MPGYTGFIPGKARWLSIPFIFKQTFGVVAFFGKHLVVNCEHVVNMRFNVDLLKYNPSLHRKVMKQSQLKEASPPAKLMFVEFDQPNNILFKF